MHFGGFEPINIHLYKTYRSFGIQLSETIQSGGTIPESRREVKNLLY